MSHWKVHLEQSENNIFMDHTPVLLAEIISSLDPQPNKIYLDCTFGAGGHTKAILERGAKVIALDRDIENTRYLEQIPSEYRQNASFYNAKFSTIATLFHQHHWPQFDGILYDIGVSSMQLDQAHRGFSFQLSGPLHMQMGLDKTSAADIVNYYEETKLANLIYELGGEKKSRSIAKAICIARKKTTIATTDQLSQIIQGATGYYGDKIHPATRTFQALRIAVNGELNELTESLRSAPQLLKAGGILAVITFHSLEDQIAKRIIEEYAGRTKETVNRYDVTLFHKRQTNDPILEIVTKKPIIPSEQEIRQNPRSRSAKLRVAKKLANKKA